LSAARRDARVLTVLFYRWGGRHCCRGACEGIYIEREREREREREGEREKESEGERERERAGGRESVGTWRRWSAGQKEGAQAS